MKRVLNFLVFILLSSFAYSQIIPEVQTWGLRWPRGGFDSTVYIPTGCGAPSGVASLRSYGVVGLGQKLLRAAKYYDSCGHHEYVWDPALQAWHMTDSSAGGGGLSPVPNLSTLINVSGGSAIPTAGNLGALNVKWFGAGGDSTGDDYAAIQATIDAASIWGGGVYVPDGRYICSQTIHTHPGKPIHFYGDAPPGLTYVGNFTSIVNRGGAMIVTTSDNDTAFRNSANGTIIENIGFKCNTATVTTTNIGIYLDSANGVIMNNVMAQNYDQEFYWRQGAHFLFSHLHFVDAKTIAFHAQSYDGLDAGDGRVEFLYGYNTAAAHPSANQVSLKVENGGGLKVLNSKLGRVAVTWNGFTDFDFEGNSCEGIDSGLSIILQPGGSMANCKIINNQFALSGPFAIKVDARLASAQSITITGNTAGFSTATGDTAIILLGGFSNSVVDATNISYGFGGNPIAVYAPLNGSYATVSIAAPPKVQTITEAPHMKVDLNNGTLIELAISSNNDTLEITNSGTANKFDIHLGSSGPSNIVLSGGTNLSEISPFTIYVEPGENVIHCANIKPNTFYVTGVDKHGLLFQKFNTAGQNAISGPQSGLAIWNTDSLDICVYTGSAWLKERGAGGGGGGSLTSTQVGFGSVSNTLTGSANLVWDNTNSLLGISNSTSNIASGFNVHSNYSSTGDTWAQDFGNFGMLLSNNRNPTTGAFVNQAVSPNQFKASSISVGGTSIFSVANFPAGSLTSVFNIPFTGAITVGRDQSIAGKLSIGATNFTPANPLQIIVDQNAGTIASVENPNSGTAAYSEMKITGGASVGHLYVFPSTYTTAAYQNSTTVGGPSFGTVILSTSNIALKANNDLSLQLPGYGSGAFTGTATKNLAVDASGNVIEVPTSGGGSSGAYLPTITPGANLTGATSDSTFWTREGNIVTVYGSMTVTITAASNTSTLAAIQLPVASALGAHSLWGGGSTTANSTGTEPICTANVSTATAAFQFYSATTGSMTVYFNFRYIVH